MPVIDQTASWFQQYLSGPIIFRQITILGSFTNLQVPEQKPKQRNNQQKPHTENDQPSMKIPNLCFWIMSCRHVTAYIRDSDINCSILN